MNLDEKKKFIINITYFVIWFVIIFLIFKLASEYLLPFSIGIIVAYLVQKPARYISLKSKFKKETLAAILSVLFFTVIVSMIVLVGWFFYLKIADLFECFSANTEKTQKIFNKITLYADKMFSSTNIGVEDAFKNVLYDMLQNSISRIGSFISSTIANFLKKLPAFLIGSIVTVVATCYISKDFERLKKFLKGIISNEKYVVITNIKNIIVECFLKFAVGYFKIFLITFVELLIGLMILGNKNFISMALLIAFLDLFPVLGTGTVLLPWSLISFLRGNMLKGTGLVVLYVVITVIRNFIEPKIIGNQIEINPLFMLIFIFLGLQLGGLIGMLFLPLVLTIGFTYFRNKYIRAETK